MLVRLLTLALILFTLASPRTAAADAARDAEAEFAQAQQYYREGRLAESVAILLELRKRFDDPILLYNLARAYEGLGDNQRALDSYSEYLAADPSSDSRGAIEKRIAALRDQIAEKKRLEQEKLRLAKKRPAPAPRPEKERGAGPWPWLVTGAGVVLLGVGATFGVIAKQSENDAESEPAQTRANDALERGRSQATIANVALVAGGVVTAGGIVWLVLGSGGNGKKGTSASLSLGPSGAFLSIQN